MVENASAKGTSFGDVSLVRLPASRANGLLVASTTAGPPVNHVCWFCLELAVLEAGIDELDVGAAVGADDAETIAVDLSNCRDVVVVFGAVSVVSA